MALRMGHPTLSTGSGLEGQWEQVNTGSRGFLSAQASGGGEEQSQRTTDPFVLCIRVLIARQQCDFSDSCGFFA